MNSKTSGRSAMTLPPGSAKLRKLAVYGRRSSGKTCILSALAMSRLANPRGYSCLWISDHGNCPEVTAEENRQPDDPWLARWRGKDMLTTQIERIDKGLLPEATELKHPLRLIYQFTKSETTLRLPDEREPAEDTPWKDAVATFFVELIDYSGELINPSNDTTFAGTLAAHLEQCDGLLILAEATTTPEQNSRLHADLELLGQVLPAVTESRKKNNAGPFPIALLLNKWDRMVDCETLTPSLLEASRQDLPVTARSAAFQKVADEIQTSRDELFRQATAPQNSLAQQLVALAGGSKYFKTFCLSALGACRSEVTADGGRREIPVSTRPLMSFGLEDPFIWIAQCGDALRLNTLETCATQLRPWYLHLLCSGLPKRISGEYRRLRALYPESHGITDELRTVRQRLIKLFASASVIATSLVGLVLVLSVLAVVAMRDSAQWSRFGPLLDQADLDRSGAELQSLLVPAEDYVSGYIFPKWYRALSYLLIQPRDQASQYHQALKNRLSELQTEQLLLARLEKLRESALTQQAELSSLETLLEAVRQLQIPDEFTRARGTHSRVSGEIETLVMKGKYGAGYLEQQTEMDDAITVGNVVRASEIIRNCPDNSWKDQLKVRFCSQAPRVMSDKIRRLMDAANPNPVTARSTISEYRSNLQEIMSMDQLELLCARWDDFVQEYSEYHFYSLCVADSDNPATLKTYLEMVGNDGPRAELVKARIEYLDWLEQPRDWNLAIRLNVQYHSGNDFNNPDVTAYLEAEGVVLASRKVEDLVPGTEISGLSGRLIGRKPGDDVRLNVRFLVEYGVFGTYDNNLGQYNCNRRLSDLATEGAIRLPKNGGDSGAEKNVVELSVTPEIDAGIPFIRLEPAGTPPILEDEEFLK